MKQVAQGTIGLLLTIEAVDSDGKAIDTRTLASPLFSVRIWSRDGVLVTDTWTAAATTDGRAFEYSTAATELDRLGVHEVHLQATAAGGKVYKSHRPYSFEVVAP